MKEIQESSNKRTELGKSKKRIRKDIPSKRLLRKGNHKELNSVSEHLHVYIVFASTVR